MNVQLFNAAFVLFISLVLFASVGLWVRAIVRLRFRQPIVTPEPRVDLPWGLADLLVAILLQYVTAEVARDWLGIGNEGKQQEAFENLAPAEQAYMLLFAAVVQLAAWVLTVGWLVLRHRVALRELGVDPRRIAFDLKLGAAAFAMLAPIVYGLQYVLAQFVKSEHPLIEVLKKESGNEFFVMSGFAAVLVAPLVEESIFRVLIQGWLERVVSKVKDAQAIVLGGRLPPPPSSESAAQPSAAPHPASFESTAEDGFNTVRGRMAIFGSAALFALAHFSHGPDPIPLFVFALGLGYLYQTTQRIVPCIVLHALLNASTLAMLWIATRQGLLEE